MRRISPLVLFLALAGCGRQGFSPDDVTAPGATPTTPSGTPASSATPTPPAGTADPGFGLGGRVSSRIGDNSAALAAIAGPNGTVLVAGRLDLPGSQTHIGVARFDSTGALDATFGTGGWADINASNAAWANALALAPDGKIWVAATTDDGDQRRATLVRLDADGTEDTSFSAVDIGPGAQNAEARAIAMRPDGSFYTGALWVDDKGRRSWEIALRNADGSKANGFGNGFVKLACSNTCELSDIATDASGGVFVGGEVLNRVVVTKLRADGANDPGFSQFTSLFVVNSTLAHLTVLANGGLLLAGGVGTSGGSDLALVRLNANGSLDATFDGDGIATYDLGGTNEIATRALSLPDGTIALGATSSGLGVLCLNADGSVQPAFGTSGWASTGTAAINDRSIDLIVQPTGLVVAGTDQSSPNSFVLARFLR